jgi:hypothetical protein
VWGGESAGRSLRRGAIAVGQLMDLPDPDSVDAIDGAYDAVGPRPDLLGCDRGQVMLKLLLCCSTLLTIAMAGQVSAQPRATHSQAIEKRDIKLPGTDYRIVLDRTGLQPPAGSSQQDLLTAIETWPAVEFYLQAIHSHPQIEFVPAAKIVALRYKGILPDPQSNFALNDRATSWRSIPTPRGRSISQKDGPAARRPSCRFSSTRWFITRKTRAASKPMSPGARKARLSGARSLARPVRPQSCERLRARSAHAVGKTKCLH